MKKVKNIGVIGAGVIGASWTAFYLSKGFHVNAFDPVDEFELPLKQRVQTYLLDLVELEGKTKSEANDFIEDSLKRLTCHHDLVEAVRDADFIQENGPERIELKKDLFTKLTHNCPSDTIIASSSSGLKISDIQKDCLNPGRVILGHPFNPPHLLPLVEIVGGDKTEKDTIKNTFDFYQSLGKKPILIQKEVTGHVANRLQSAIWREAMYLVSEGVCSVEDIDIAITNGPGLRWAIFGPYLNMELANQKGFKTAIQHLGGPISEWWADMYPYAMSAADIEKFDKQTQRFIKKLGIKNIQATRDEALLKILKMRKDFNLP